MDTARYVFAVLVVAFLPPAVVWWYVVHPFTGFWRKLGPKVSLTVMGVLMSGAIAGLIVIRDRLVLTDLGTHWPLVPLAVALMASCVWIALRRRKHLTNRILAGVPQLSSDPDDSVLLTDGIYAQIRNPRYVEVVLGTLAYAVFANYVGSYLVAFATIPGVHLIVLLEERELLERFGDEYRRYMERVPRYVPRRWWSSGD